LFESGVIEMTPGIDGGKCRTTYALDHLYQASLSGSVEREKRMPRKRA